MAMSDLVFDIFAIDRASAVFDRVGASAEGSAMTVERAQKKMAAGLLTAGAIAVGLGVKSLEMSANFDAAMTRLTTTAGESPAALKKVSAGILDMTSKVGFSASELASAMYDVESGGFHGAQGLKVLEAAAKGARIEGANVTDVAHALTGALNDYRGKNLSAVEATNAMTAAVGSGMMRFQDLAEALPKIGARAAAANVTFGETLAALATMTKDGLPASVAATYLGQSIGQLAAPSKKASDEMDALGINATRLSATLMSGSGHGLGDAIKMLYDGIEHHLVGAGVISADTFHKMTASSEGFRQVMAHLPPDAETTVGALAKMTGGVRSFQGVLMIGGKHVDQYNESLNAVNDQIKKGGQDVAGFAEIQQNLSQKWNDARGAASSLAVEMGNNLTPAANDVLGVMTDLFTFLGEHNGVVTTLEVAVAGLAGAFVLTKTAAAGAALMNGILASSEAATALGMTATAVAAGDLSGAMAGLSLAMDATPFGLVATAIAGVVAGIVALNGGFSNSDAAAAQNQQAIKDLAGTYDALTGAVTKATRAQIAHDLSTMSANSITKVTTASDGHQFVAAGDYSATNIMALGQKAGINQTDLISAAQGQRKAVAIVRAEIAAYGKTSAAAAVEARELSHALGLESSNVRQSAKSAREAWLENQNLTKSLKGVKGGTELAHSAYISNIQDLATLAAKHKWTGQEIQQVINAEWQPAMAKAQGITKTNVQQIVATMNTFGTNAKGAMQIAGGDARAGLVAGFAPVINQMAALGAQAFIAAEAAIRKHGQTHSPSRKMYKVGTDMGDGLTGGFRESTQGLADIGARVIAVTLAQANKETKKQLNHQLAVDSAALTKVNQQIQAAQAWGQAFGGNVFSQTFDPGMVTSTTSSTIGGVSVTATGSAPASGTTLLQQMFAYQHQQHAQASKLNQEIKKLRGEGISQSVLDAMSAGGAQGLAQIAALAGATPAQVKQFSNLVSSTNSLYANAGAEATVGQSMSTLQKEKRDDARQVAVIKKALHGLSINVHNHHGHVRTS